MTDDIGDAEQFCRSLYNDVTDIVDNGRVHEDHTPVTEQVSPDVYSDFEAAYGDLVVYADVYEHVVTTIQRRESIGRRVGNSVYVDDDTRQMRTLDRVQDAFDGVWRDDEGYDPFSGLSDAVVETVEEFAGGF